MSVQIKSKVDPLRLIAGLFLIVCHLATAGVAQDRLALVVGIDSYANINSLMKARNDASAVHAVLSDAGFRSTLVLDPTSLDMIRAVRDFAAQLGPGDEALFYFAGHGVQIDGRNYLLMSDIPALAPGDELLLTSQALPVDVVLDEIRTRGTRVVMLILDACRDNPFPRDGLRTIGAERGLAAAEAPEGTFIMFSAGDGQTALDRLSDDDADPNSVFTRSLLRYLDEPGLAVHELARRVRSDVRDLAATVGHRQFPAIYDQFDGLLTIVPATLTAAPVVEGNEEVHPSPSVATAIETAQDPCEMALSIWEVLMLSPTPEALEAFITTYGRCDVLRLLAEDRLAQMGETVPNQADNTEAEPALTEPRYSLLLPVPSQSDPRIADGRELFARQCIACHVIENARGEILVGRNARTGPNLYGVAGRTAGSYPGFEYSEALMELREISFFWDQEALTGYLQDPTDFVREVLDNRRARQDMAFQVRDAEDVEAIFLFLSTCRDDLDVGCFQD